MVRARFLGHSCWQLEADGHSVIIDPFLTGNPVAAAKPEEIKAEAVLITHGHSDHVGDALAIAKANDALIVGCFEVATYFQQKGANAHPMHLGGGHTFPFGHVTLTPALHGSGFVEDGRMIYMGNPAGLLIEMGDRIIYHAGDTALFSDMSLIGRRKKIDLALLPIGDNFTMGLGDAVEAVKFLNPALVVPMHYNTFDLINADAGEFARRVHAETGARCQVVEPGGVVSV